MVGREVSVGRQEIKKSFLSTSALRQEIQSVEVWFVFSFYFRKEFAYHLVILLFDDKNSTDIIFMFSKMSFFWFIFRLKLISQFHQRFLRNFIKTVSISMNNLFSSSCINSFFFEIQDRRGVKMNDIWISDFYLSTACLSFLFRQS